MPPKNQREAEVEAKEQVDPPKPELDSGAQERPETGFKDVSEATEKAAEQQDNPTVDPETGMPEFDTEAAIEVQQEQAYRSGVQANGGGPWPPELLKERFSGATPLEPPAPVYTSHEEAEG